MTTRWLTAILFCIAHVPAQGDLLYGSHSSGTALVRIHPGSLAATVVGPFGFSQVGGLAFGTDGVLYGLETAGDSLLRVDTATGAAARIGLTGVNMTFNTGLASDPTTGSLYAVAQSRTGASSVLVTLSRTTGAATVVGDTRASAIIGLDFDATGQLWGIDGSSGHDELVRIDKNTAGLTVISAMGLASFPNIGSLAIGRTGRFWSVNVRSPRFEMVLIDPVLGTGIVVGTLPAVALAVTGLASHPCGEVASQQVARAGLPPNPPAFLAGTRPPVLGWTWNPRIDHTSFLPNAFADLLLLSPRRVNLPTPFGTLLVDAGALVILTGAPGVPFAVSVPNNCALAGASLPSQGAAASVQTVALANGLDVVVGTY